jgi:hypothetical protein
MIDTPSSSNPFGSAACDTGQQAPGMIDESALSMADRHALGEGIGTLDQLHAVMSNLDRQQATGEQANADIPAGATTGEPARTGAQEGPLPVDQVVVHGENGVVDVEETQMARTVAGNLDSLELPRDFVDQSIPGHSVDAFERFRDALPEGEHQAALDARQGETIARLYRCDRKAFDAASTEVLRGAEALGGKRFRDHLAASGYLADMTLHQGVARAHASARAPARCPTTAWPRSPVWSVAICSRSGPKRP